MKVCQIALIALSAGVCSTAPAALVTLSGEALLTTAEASFPSTQPVVSGTALVFQFQRGSSLEKLVSFRVNADNSLPMGGAVTISATWNLTRLACSGQCIGGDVDWDPHFLLSDGSTMLGFLTADDSGGEVQDIRLGDAGSTGYNRSVSGSESGTGYPGVGESMDVRLDYTLLDGAVTARIRYLGADRVASWSTALSRTTDLALVFGQDNDSGERYQINSLQVTTPDSVPEPASLALIGIGVAGLAACRRPSFSYHQRPPGRRARGLLSTRLTRANPVAQVASPKKATPS